MLGRAPVSVRVVAGGWYPHSQSDDQKSSFTSLDEEHIVSYSGDMESNFARITISNDTGRDIPNTVIKVGDNETDLWNYDAVVLRKENDKIIRQVVGNATDKVDVGLLPAAQYTIVYLWSTRGFSYPYDLSDIQVMTTDGRVSKTIAEIKGSSEEVFLGISTETIAWVFMFTLVGICVFLLWALNYSFSFAKSLLKSEDYYLSERIRFDSNPEKYSIPDSLPKT